jgi:hypothetical protein
MLFSSESPSPKHRHVIELNHNNLTKPTRNNLTYLNNRFSRHLTMSLSGKSSSPNHRHIIELTTESNFELTVASDGAL